jgi:hypothetical protein
MMVKQNGAPLLDFEGAWAQLDAVDAFVRDLTGGDGWIDLVPGDVETERGDS